MGAFHQQLMNGVPRLIPSFNKRLVSQIHSYAMHGRNALGRFSIFIGIFLLLAGCSRPPANLNVQQQSDGAHSLGVAKRHLKQGKLEIAEQEIKSLLHVEPTNQEAYYYLNLIHEAKFQESRREQQAKDETNGLWYPTLPPRRVQ